MPIYEFNCSACSVVFEELVRSSTEQVNCPKCGGTKVERQLSTFAAHGLSGPSGSASAGGGGCGGCSGGNCSSCH